MTDLELIEKALRAIDENVEAIAAKRPSKANANKLQSLDMKKANLAAIQAEIESGLSLLDIYVAKEEGSEVGRILEVGDSTKVEIEYLGGATAEVELADLLYDAKATDMQLTGESNILYQGKSYRLASILYPGIVQVEGLDGIIPADQWTLDQVEEVEEVEDIETSVIVPEAVITSELPEKAPKVVFTSIVFKETEGQYEFVIGKLENEKLVGQLYVLNGDVSDLVLQTLPHDRFHWVRSILVMKYHKEVKPLKAGDKMAIKPWLLGFASENREVYHPTTDEENVADILEDLNNGGTILQRIGVSTEGEIYSGYRRTLAAIKAELETVPIEVSSFETRVDFIEALFSANKQREKTPEMKAREREIRYKYCSQEAKAAQLAALQSYKNSPDAPKPLAGGSAWERTVAKEPDISPSTASAQSKILQWADTHPDRELATVVLDVFNSGDKRTKTCQDLIEYAQQGKKEATAAKAAARLILDGGANSLPKAIAKGQLPEYKKSASKGVYQRAPGAIPADTSENGTFINSSESGSFIFPNWLMELVFEVLGDIDIDVLSGADAATDARMHFTGASSNLDGLKTDWHFPDDEGAVVCYGNIFVNNETDWARAIAAQWVKGNILEGIFFFHKPSLEARSILKKVASASADILQSLEIKVKGKYHSKSEVTAYYLGTNWQNFANSFDPQADVKMPRWAFDNNYKSAFSEDTLTWHANTNGAAALYKGFRLNVLKVADGSWQAEINDEAIANELTDEATAKTIAAFTADERLVAA